MNPLTDIYRTSARTLLREANDDTRTDRIEERDQLVALANSWLTLASAVELSDHDQAVMPDAEAAAEQFSIARAQLADLSRSYHHHAAGRAYMRLVSTAPGLT